MLSSNYFHNIVKYRCKYFLLAILILSGVLFSTMAYAKNGSFVWAKGIGQNKVPATHGIAYIYDITVDASGNSYTIGWFEGTVDFDPGVGEYFLTSYSPSPDFYKAVLNQKK